MNAHSTDSASVALPDVKARGESPNWLPAQMSHSPELSPSFSGILPASSNLSAAVDNPMTPGEDTAITLRSRLLQMIVANEQSRKSQTADSGPHE